MPYRRLGGGTLIAAACLGVGLGLGRSLGSARPVLDVAVVALFPVLLVVFRAVPREHFGVAVRVLRSLIARPPSADSVRARLRDLSHEDLRLVSAIVRDRQSSDQVANAEGVSESFVRERLVGVLRRLGIGGTRTAADAAIGAYLLSTESVAERDAKSRRLLAEGVEPADLAALESTYREMLSSPRGAWELGTVEELGTVQPVGGHPSPAGEIRSRSERGRSAPS